MWGFLSKRLDRTHWVVLKYSVLINQFRLQRGAWKINTAQSLIILIAIGCAGLIYNTYKKSQNVAPPIPVSSAASDPRFAGYAARIKAWQTQFAKAGLVVTWPYLGQDQVVRVDLPKQQPVTLAPWDDVSEAGAATQSYKDFVNIRKASRIGDSAGCMVHVFDSTGVEIAVASATGVAPAQPE